MSTSNKTMIDAAKYQNILETLGIAYEIQTGWVKCKFAKGRNVYVANQKRVGAVHISGFSLRTETGEHQPGFVEPDVENGSVEQHLDLSLPEAQVLENFTTLLLFAASLAPREIVRKSRNKKDDGAKGWVKPVSSSAASSPEAQVISGA